MNAETAKLTASQERNRRILLGAGWSIFVRGGSFIVTLVTIPLAIDALGSEKFGAWITITASLTLLGFLDGGMANAVINLVAHRNADGDTEGIREIISTAIGTLSLIATFGVLATILMVQWIDWRWLLNLTSAVSATEIRHAIMTAAAFFFANFALSVVQRVRRGLQESHRNEIFEALGIAAKLVAVLVAAMASGSLTAFIVAFSIGQLVGSATNCCSLFWWERPDLRPTFSSFSKSTVRLLTGTGFLFLGLQLCAAISFQTDALIVTRFYGLAAAAELGLAMRLFGLSTTLATLVTAPLWPAFRDACSRNDFPWIRRTFRHAFSVTLGCSLALTGLIFIFREQLLSLWSGDKVVPSSVMLFAVFLWSNMLAAGGLLAMLLNGLHIVRLQLILSFIMTLLNLLFSIILTHWIGPVGVVVGSLLSYTCCILIPYALLLPRILQDQSVATVALR